ncbi:MAG: multidrug ABC transporter ATP-binding protein [Bacteroidetes bacterium QS_3_64_15]|nr:MAG: multidrug ABC transporter ATP-binding protein [Bacteroidetes bacterium QS_3_64_15]
MDTALSIQSLRKTYGATVAVDDLSLKVEPGEIFGLIGPNGAGKTTTVECLLGLRRPDAGSVQVLGMTPQDNPPDLAHRVGAQLQEAALPSRITVAEALDLFGSFYSETRAPDALLDRWGLADERTTPFEALSGGQQQRLFVILAFLHNPDLVVLDEISTGLDPEARRDTRDLIRELRAEGTTVVLVTHFMDEAQALCDRVALLHEGRCVALDAPAALIDRLDAPYRVRFAAPPAFDPAPLRDADGVTQVARRDGEVRVRGREDLLTSVVRHLAAQNAIPDDLHAERATLEDVFLTIANDLSSTQVQTEALHPEKEPS